MTKAQLHNALRILQSIDRHELDEAGVEIADTVAWLKFRDDPFRWFIRACDADADKVWEIVERRARHAIKARRDAGATPEAASPDLATMEAGDGR